MDIIIPGASLILAFSLKLFTARVVNPTIALKEFIAVPPDVVFATLAFVIGAAIASPEASTGFAIGWLLLTIAVAVLCIFLTRLADEKFERTEGWQPSWSCGAYLLVNTMIALSFAVICVWSIRNAI